MCAMNDVLRRNWMWNNDERYIQAVLIFDIWQILSKILCSNEIQKMIFTSHSGFHLLSSRSYWSWFWNMFSEESCFAQQLKIKHILLTWMDNTQVPLFKHVFPLSLSTKKSLPVYCWKLHVVVCHCCATKNSPDLSVIKRVEYIGTENVDCRWWDTSTICHYLTLKLMSWKTNNRLKCHILVIFLTFHVYLLAKSETTI